MRGLSFAVACVVAACSSSGPPRDAGVVDPDAGTCCPRGIPQAGNCGPVDTGGFSVAGACKQATIGAGRVVRSGTDLHGCSIWIDDGPCAFDADVCAPMLDTSGFTVGIMPPPRPPSPNACTLQDIANFAACWSGDTSKCSAVDASTCDACLVSQSTDAAWGPLVMNAPTPWNIGGCVDLVRGDTSCGQAAYETTSCFDYACGSCAPFTSSKDGCESQERFGGCGGYFDAMTYACAVDGSAPDTSACMENTSITDPTLRARDFITRLATRFCGP